MCPARESVVGDGSRAVKVDETPLFHDPTVVSDRLVLDWSGEYHRPASVVVPTGRFSSPSLPPYVGVRPPSNGPKPLD